jgi:hypothetical protein
MREITPPTYFLSSLTDWTRKDVRSRNLNDEMKDEMQDADKARRSYLLNNLAESHVPSFLPSFLPSLTRLITSRVNQCLDATWTREVLR